MHQLCAHGGSTKNGDSEISKKQACRKRLATEYYQQHHNHDHNGWPWKKTTVENPWILYGQCVLLSMISFIPYFSIYKKCNFLLLLSIHFVFFLCLFQFIMFGCIPNPIILYTHIYTSPPVRTTNAYHTPVSSLMGFIITLKTMNSSISWRTFTPITTVASRRPGMLESFTVLNQPLSRCSHVFVRVVNGGRKPKKKRPACGWLSLEPWHHVAPTHLHTT